MILKKNSDVLCAIKYHKQRITQIWGYELFSSMKTLTKNYDMKSQQLFFDALLFKSFVLFFVKH